jgi:Ni/Co efflux regulator RcnB
LRPHPLKSRGIGKELLLRLVHLLTFPNPVVNHQEDKRERKREKSNRSSKRHKKSPQKTKKRHKVNPEKEKNNSKILLQETSLSKVQIK